MKSTSTERVSIFVGDVKPIDPGFVQKVCDYLDRIENWVTTNPEARHVRLLTARRPRVSNTQAHVIRSAFVTRATEHSVLPRWIQDSVILWDRELIEAEIISSRGLAMQGANPRAISPSRDIPSVLSR